MATDQPEVEEPVISNSPGAGLSNYLARLLDRFQPSSELVLMATALIVGIGASLGAVIFRYLINGVDWIGYVWFPQTTSGWGKAYVVIIPAIGGMLVGPLVYFFNTHISLHSVDSISPESAWH